MNTCLNCGKMIHRKRSQYCSKSCFDIYRMKRVEKVCTNCRKTFKIQASRINKTGNNFCSHICYSIFSIGKNNNQWNGGTSFSPYPPTFNKQFKDMIRSRDNETCQICKNPGKDVHHINYVKNDTVPENCVTLCRSCHAGTNSNREYWIEYFNQKHP